MMWADLIWLPPIMLAVALVLGSAGRQGFTNTTRSVVHTFVALTLGVIAVGVGIHLVARIFA
ncbi:MAG: hypothetical protein JRF70_11335 [Deltaproteobacteria bacterium]|nr:hypothetical protein [Deltaproteobacteria bacterium]